MCNGHCKKKVTRMNEMVTLAMAATVYWYEDGAFQEVPRISSILLMRSGKSYNLSK